VKERLDVLLVERNLVRSRSQARALIKSGDVLVAGEVVTKPGHPTDPEASIEIQAESDVVGRGYYKLEHALDHFKLKVQDLICADIGASTGGFTQLLLRRGAQRVYAIDVGHEQLHSSLLSDQRVINMEGTHINQASLPEKVDLCVIDLSFISLRKVMESIIELGNDQLKIIALIKPQFEGEARDLNQQGIVKTEQRRSEILQELLADLDQLGVKLQSQVIESPISGKKGNVEYLGFFLKGEVES
jgi:23S rRNA (cytidine1920-2'-O)/16S rRNA (cytidine1409-2'-O)-methyltransferase